MEGQIELVVVAFSLQEQSREVVTALRRLSKDGSIEIITGVELVKGIDGQTSMKSSLQMERSQRTKYGALAGALVGLLAGPAGVVAGATAGAAIGRATTKKPELEFTEDVLKRVTNNMQPDSSAIVALVESERAESFVEALVNYDGRIIRQPLSAEMVEQLAEHRSTDKPAVAEEGDLEAGAVEGVEVKVRELLREGTRSGLGFKRIHVVINPASGQNQPILNQLNTVFHVAGVDWDVSITKQAGDASRQARAAAEAGFDVVAGYGGDGTVMEVANGLMGTGVPQAILPGGTSNVMSNELGISKNLVEAAALICGAPAIIRPIDMGKAGDELFILRVDLGLFADAMVGATRELKDRIGGAAYSLAGLKALRGAPVARYHMELDGETVEAEALICFVANSANIGMPNVYFAQDVSVSDGLLDVVLVGKKDLESLISFASTVANVKRIGKPLAHWQVREATISADPPQQVAGDGEVWDQSPISLSVLPAAANIIVPDSG